MNTPRLCLKISVRSTILSLLLIVSISSVSVAQPNHTAFFMNNSPIATRLNPAMQPDRGFVTIPAIGSTGVSYFSNGFALQDIFYRKGNKVVTFMDESVNADKFLRGLKANNTLTVDSHIDIVNVGWFTRQGSFWSVGVNVKTTVSSKVPISLLDFMKRGINLTSGGYEIGNFSLNARSYIEGSVGYSRKVRENITVGARVKILTGVGDIDMHVDNISATRSGGTWAMKSRARVSAAIYGGRSTLSTDAQGNDYVSGFDYGSFGLAGWGGGLDLGVTYTPIKRLLISASILDLGFIRWGQHSMVAGEVDGDYTFEGFKPNEPNTSAGDQLSDLGDNLMNMMHVSEIKPRSRTTSLYTTINIGVEYSILHDDLGFGLLSSTKFYPSKVYSELTASINSRPCSWFSGSLSYSFMYSQFKSFGIALNFHPGFINFFVGSDYVFFRAKKGIPQFSKATNLHIGMAVPLGQRPRHSANCKR